MINIYKIKSLIAVRICLAIVNYRKLWTRIKANKTRKIIIKINKHYIKIRKVMRKNRRNQRYKKNKMIMRIKIMKMNNSNNLKNLKSIKK